MIAKVLNFAKVSGVGLGLDVCLFLLLVRAGWPPGYANFLSASMAVTFVYFVSTKHVFEYQGRFLMPLFLAYCAYQVLAVAGASWAVDRIAAFGIMPVISKGLVLPFTFSANYLFLDFLVKAVR